MEKSTLNRRAHELCDELVAASDRFGVRVVAPKGAAENSQACRIVDCGIEVPGSWKAGQLVSRICLAGMAEVELARANLGQARLSDGEPSQVLVHTDRPLEACLHSQYAGWMIQGEHYFAMGSGPMRCAAAKEPLFLEIGGQESAKVAVGILESREYPPDEVCQKLANDCGVEPARLTLLIAPTASIVGTTQIVARSVETALHKLHELAFDVTCVRRGQGQAPLPPIETVDSKKAGKAADTVAMGRTNDAILYGAEVKLWCDCSDEVIRDIVPRVPSVASHDYGRPFGELFAAYDYDFYKIDKLLFSPASITLVSIQSGNEFHAGRVNDEILARSFGAIN